MTKAWILSDLHIDHAHPDDAPRVPETHPDADIIIMAGDLADGDFDVVPWLREHFSADELARTVYVPGNHDYWNVDRYDAERRLAGIAATGVTVLHNDETEIAAVRIVGTTLWTRLQMSEALHSHVMDFTHIPGFSPEQWIARHMHAEQYLRDTLEEGDILVTHHAPSYEGLSGEMQHNPRMIGYGGAYGVNLEPLIRERRPALVVHGHTHVTRRYEIGDVPVVTNARGPIGWSYDPNFVVEITPPAPRPKGL